jgi:Secretion system C-terminal sorting domain
MTMKTNKYLLLLFLLAAWFSPSTLKAQSCINAHVVTSFAPQTIHAINGEGWITFTAPTNFQGVLLKSFSTAYDFGVTIFDIDTVKVYSGNCNALSLVTTYIPVSGQKCLVNFAAVASNVYYIKISNSCNCSKAYTLSLPHGDPVCTAACDLVCNGDFELTSDPLPLYPTCSNMTNTGCWNYFYNFQAGIWENTDDYTPSWGNQGSPDYFNASANIPTLGSDYWMGIPYNFAGYQQPLSGTAYTGVFAYITDPQYFNNEFNANNCTKEYREYIQQGLCEPMVKGRHYRVSFSANLANSSAYATYLGALFTMDTIWQQTPTGICAGHSGECYTAQAPQFETPNMISDTLNWVTSTFMFNADTGYSHISIGNFRMAAQANRSLVYPSNLYLHENPFTGLLDTLKVAYYLLDSVSITPVDTLMITGNDSICFGANTILTASINGLDSNGIAIDTAGTQVWFSFPNDTALYHWQDKAIITVSPNVTTTYICHFKDRYGCDYIDTFKVVVMPNPSIQIVPLLGENANVNCTTVEYGVVGDLPNSLHIWTAIPYGIVNDTALTATVNWNNTLGSIGVVVVTPFGCKQDISLDVIKCCEVGGQNFNGTTGIIRITNDSASHILNDPLYASVLFSGDSIKYNNFMLFNGVFIIDTLFTYWNCPLIAMGTNAEVIVRPSKTLTYDNSIIQNKCDTMWEGIHVEDPTAKVRIIKNSVMQNAKNLVYSANGGRFEIENSTLRNNVIGIDVHEYNQPTNSYVRGTTFNSTGTFLPSIPAHPIWLTSPLYGIQVEDQYQIQIGDSTLASYQNTFNKMLVGINIKRGRVSVYNNTFKNITARNNAAVPTGYAIDAIGSKIVAGNPINTLIVGTSTASANSKNTFNTCSNGIRVFLPFITLVQGNSFQKISNTVCESKNTSYNQTYYRNTINATTVPFKFGIKVTDPGLGKVTINNNGILGSSQFQFGNFNRYGVGILLESTNGLSKTSEILRNGVNRTRTGIWIRGIQPQGTDSLLLRGNLINMTTNWGASGAPTVPHTGVNLQDCQRIYVDSTDIRTTGNTVPLGSDSLIRGILVENTTYSVVSDNYLRNMQSGIIARDFVSNTFYVCNQFNRNRTGILFTGTGGSADVGANQLTLNNVNYPTGNHFNNMPGAFDLKGDINPAIDWFYNIGNPINNGMQSSSFTSGNPVNLGSQPSPCGQFYLPPLDNGTPTPTKRTTTIGSTVVTNMQQSVDSNAAYFGNLYVIKVMRGNTNFVTLNNFDDPQYQAFYAAKNPTCMGSMCLVNENVRNGNMQAANIANSAIVSQSTKTMNHKTVYEIYFRTWDSGQVWFTQSDSATLHNIAILSPYYAGEAVYMARIMLGLDYEEFGNNNSNRLAPPSQNDETIVQGQTSIYPNPSTDYVTLETSFPENSTVQYQIYDLNGRIVTSGTLSSGASRTTINTSETAEGVYQVSFIVNGELYETKKMVIVKKTK